MRVACACAQERFDSRRRTPKNNSKPLSFLERHTLIHSPAPRAIFQSICLIGASNYRLKLLESLEY